MKFDRKELLKSLSLLKPAIDPNSSIAQLKHIWFEGNKAFAYNSGLGINIDLKTGFNFAVLGTPLLKLLSDGSANEISLEKIGEALVVKLGRAMLELPIMDSSASPWIFPKKPELLAELPLGGSFRKALKRASLVKTNDPIRVEHFGVILFSDKQDELLLYTTDSRTMIEVAIQAMDSRNVNKTVLPFEFVEVIRGFDDGYLSICKDCLIAEADGISVYSNLLDSSGVADLPKLLDGIMQDKATQKMVPLPSGLVGALGRAEVLADGGPLHLKLSVENSQLSLDGKLPLGNFREIIPLGKSSVEASIGIDGILLKKVLSESKQFAIAGERLVLLGEDNFVFVQAAYSS